MKYQILTIFLVFSLYVTAQTEYQDVRVFVRIYDLDGKKTYKGTIQSISETSIELYSKGKTISIPLKEIGKIKTKHSGGNNVAVGALIGAGSFALLGALDGDDGPGIISFSASEKATVGLVGGAILGAGAGGITTIFKKSKHYIIDGNKLKLQEFKENINETIKNKEDKKSSKILI